MKLKYLIPIKGISWVIEESNNLELPTLIIWYNAAFICAVIYGAVKLII